MKLIDTTLPKLPLRSEVSLCDERILNAKISWGNIVGVQALFEQLNLSA